MTVGSLLVTDGFGLPMSPNCQFEYPDLSAGALWQWRRDELVKCLYTICLNASNGVPTGQWTSALMGAAQQASN